MIPIDNEVSGEVARGGKQLSQQRGLPSVEEMRTVGSWGLILPVVALEHVFVADYSFIRSSGNLASIEK